MSRLAAVLALLLATACGGGGGGASESGVLGPAPDLALVFCSGHDLLGVDPTYLDVSAGPAVEAAVAGAGYSFESFHFADEIGGSAGYAGLVALLEAIRDEWIDGRAVPARVVVVAHSHGCVRTHAALRAVPDCPVRLLVDLDGSSNGWALVHGPAEAAAMGGGPVDAYDLGVDLECAAFPAIADEDGTLYDLEDVVPGSALEALEVRSGEIALNPFQPEPYDERWNARTDGTQVGLTCHYSATSHAEVHAAAGATMALVAAWILDRLASDP